MGIFDYDFMKNAFVAILLIAPLFGIMGTMVVNNRMAFFSDALGHSAFTGLALGILLGISDKDVSMVIFAIVFALLLNYIKHKNVASADTVISVFSSLSVAVGLALLSRNGNFSKYSVMLVGDILNVTVSDIVKLVIALAVTIVVWLFCYNGLSGIGINKSIAKSKGIPVILYENIFACLVAVVVMLTVRMAGILIINALLILPAAAARNISGNAREYHLYSCIGSVFSGITGLVLSFYLDAAAGPMIAIVAAILFFVTFAAREIGRK
ncbi:MAG: metal ABC transporter permease [Lachnospiraceae bacterium]|nr:metal ABC transporter permease [Lachnospiraceae bacterium]